MPVGASASIFGLISIVNHGFIPLGAIAAFVYYLSQKTNPPQILESASLPSKQLIHSSKTSNYDVNTFRSFQRNFCIVYILALFADGLQGPYIYKLYEHYGFQEFQIAQLYVVGFASSLIFGTITGPIADSCGRKNVCLFFSVIYIVCCLSKFSHNFWILWWGRICGGISTSILYSTFEACYYRGHDR
ncbi:molybdate-anion transporter-like [Tigriopus californicus]|uniref:molybdate-anion transporter-like n=1 Tax=Tigriopus californicus TaxID=6832 RepID=UPI0027DA817C|nr:molybdate-anion transporter-like [Tigriopus californicus]